MGDDGGKHNIDSRMSCSQARTKPLLVEKVKPANDLIAERARPDPLHQVIQKASWRRNLGLPGVLLGCSTPRHHAGPGFDVRSRGLNGSVMLILSSSGFDPSETSAPRICAAHIVSIPLGANP
jgi:hypothetical protein